MKEAKMGRYLSQLPPTPSNLIVWTTLAVWTEGAIVMTLPLLPLSNSSIFSFLTNPVAFKLLRRHLLLSLIIFNSPTSLAIFATFSFLTFLSKSFKFLLLVILLFGLVRTLVLLMLVAMLL